MLRSAHALLTLFLGACGALRLPTRHQENHFIGRRRAVAISVVAASAPFFLGDDIASAASPTREGMQAFSAGKVEKSIEIFDGIIAERPAMKPYLWQRGLSLYYADKFKEGAEQFKSDVAVNPNDTEESIWYFLCLARLEGFEAAKADLLKVGEDRRPVMRAVLKLFQGETDEAALQTFASSNNGGDLFYANLYLGLWREAQGDETGARRFIKAAANSPYGKGSGDYMADLAKVHVARRGW